jgi:hypothetical protein
MCDKWLTSFAEDAEKIKKYVMRSLHRKIKKMRLAHNASI